MDAAGAPFSSIDVVVTATVRPEILDLTLLSFCKKLLGPFGHARLIINIDPIGDARRTQEDVLRVCRRHFEDVTYRCPEAPSFPEAVKWGWGQVGSEFFLHLEDDWLLKKRVDQARLMRLFDDPELASVRFNLTRNPAAGPLYTSGFSLNPSVVRKRFIDEALPFFSTGLDPEKQYSRLEGPRRDALLHWKYLLYGAPGEGSYVIDIGKKWRRAARLSKWRPGSREIAWQRDAGAGVLTGLWRSGKSLAYLALLKLMYGRP